MCLISSLFVPGDRRCWKAEWKKDQPLLSQEEKKEMLQTEVRTENKATDQQGEASAAAVHADYGCFSMACSRCSKAEIAEEFHTRNALEWNHTMAQHHQNVYQKCHDAHALRRLARNSLFNQNRAVAAGSRAYSLSKDQLEEANRGLN